MKVTAYLRDHLINVHELRPGALLNNYVRVARDYRGQKELEIIKNSNPKPASSAAAAASVSPRLPVTCTIT